MHPKYLSIKDYSYFLPEEKIAKYSLIERDASRLLIYNKGKINQDIFKNIDKYIPENSLFIFNDTKVIEARLLFQKPSGGIIEIFCLSPDERYPDIAKALSQQEKVLWQCLIGGASKWKHGQTLVKKNGDIALHAKFIEKKSDNFIIELSWSPSHLSFAEILHLEGAIPLPPYIKRKVEPSDSEHYQTIYAQYEGSVAAPTAGLHFTKNIFQKLKKKNIQHDFITLHVGSGTFKPVKSETLAQHEMHTEYIDVSKTTIQNILSNLDNDIISVGTTSLRTIESIYWLGIKCLESRINSEESLALGQWEAYESLNGNISPNESLQSLMNWMEKNNLQRLVTKTHLLIAPGYKTKIADALITNFHLPNSTLLLLVAALTGKDWKKIYEYALQNDFRFLSYGDGSLLWIS